MGEERTCVPLGRRIWRAESLGTRNALSSSLVELSSEVEELTAVGEEGVADGGGEESRAESGGEIGQARGEG